MDKLSNQLENFHLVTVAYTANMAAINNNLSNDQRNNTSYPTVGVNAAEVENQDQRHQKEP